MDGGDGDNDYVGGLVGWQGRAGSSITACYATGTVDGGDGILDYVGGLVGNQSTGSITASYSTGAVDGCDASADPAYSCTATSFGGISVICGATLLPGPAGSPQDR